MMYFFQGLDSNSFYYWECQGMRDAIGDPLFLQTSATGQKEHSPKRQKCSAILCVYRSLQEKNNPPFANGEAFCNSSECWLKKNLFSEFLKYSAVSFGLWWVSLVPMCWNYPCGIHFLFQKKEKKRKALKKWLQTAYQAVNAPLSQQLYEGSKKV